MYVNCVYLYTQYTYLSWGCLAQKLASKLKSDQSAHCSQALKVISEAIITVFSHVCSLAYHSNQTMTSIETFENNNTAKCEMTE